MAESAARRDRTDSQTVVGWYLWEAPDKPARVYLSLDLIDRLERETVENFRSLTSRGSETGGILLGSVAPGAPASISVEDYETIECDYRRGPLYRLSDADLGRFERVMEERARAGKLQVVGFFRSHTRKGLALDLEDLQLLEARFRNPHSVALLVRPFATRASVGGIFLREQGEFNSEASALEFPFRSAQLTPSKRLPEPPVAAPPASRGQVVPIATRREILGTPAALSIPVPSSEPVVEIPEIKAPEAQPAIPATIDSAVIAPAAAQESEAVPAPDATTAPASVPVNDNVPRFAIGFSGAGSTTAEPSGASEPKRASKVPMLAGLLAAALLVFVLLFIYPDFFHHWRATPATAQDSSPITLRVEHTGTDLLLTWNRESAAIQDASRATLAISDGDRHENYGMDPAQLRTGSIMYSPLGGDVSFQMEVIGHNGSRMATETLRLLRTRPSPMPAETEKTANAAPGSSVGESSEPAGGSSNSVAGDVPSAQESKSAPLPVKPFDTSSLGRRLRPAQPADLGEVPSPAAGAPVTPRVTPEGSLPFATVTAAPAPASPVAAPSQTSLTQASNQRPNFSRGGVVRQAELIFRKEPEYPALARQMGIRGIVELVATIGTNGAVKSVKVLNGHPMLVKAAQDAVMQWRFRPTQLNGVPVASDTRITLNFLH